MQILIIVMAAILLAGLLHYEKKEIPKGRLLTKTALSSLFILAVLVQPHLISSYRNFLLAGLLFCLVGDVCLALPQKKIFLYGVIAFLLGHLFFIFAFSFVTETNIWTWVGSLTISITSGLVYLWLRPHLGSMKVVVLLYVIVITIMLSAACSIMGDLNLARTGRAMVFAGALSFYLSDLFVARDRFLKRDFLNRLIGLPLYYIGQFLLAFSVGLLRLSPLT